MSDDLTRKMDAVEGRLCHVERDVAAIKTAQAVGDVQYENIKGDLGDLKRGVRWVLMILAGVVLTAAAQFVVQGGLSTLGGG